MPRLPIVNVNNTVVLKVRWFFLCLVIIPLLEVRLVESMKPQWIREIQEPV